MDHYPGMQTNPIPIAVAFVSGPYVEGGPGNQLSFTDTLVPSQSQVYPNVAVCGYCLTGYAPTTRFGLLVQRCTPWRCLSLLVRYVHGQLAAISIKAKDDRVKISVSPWLAWSTGEQ